MTQTNKEMVKNLCKSIVTRLENNKSITFAPRLRQIVFEDVYSLVGPYIVTDEEIREKTLAKLGASAEALRDSTFTESEAYKAARNIVRSQLGDDTLNGFYFIKPVKVVAEMIGGYLLRSPSIDEVYESDEDLEKAIVGTIKVFKPENAH
jgi:hypothetical protein